MRQGLSYICRSALFSTIYLNLKLRDCILKMFRRGYWSSNCQDLLDHLLTCILLSHRNKHFILICFNHADSLSSLVITT